MKAMGGHFVPTRRPLGIISEGHSQHRIAHKTPNIHSDARRDAMTKGTAHRGDPQAALSAQHATARTA